MGLISQSAIQVIDCRLRSVDSIHLEGHVLRLLPELVKDGLRLQGVILANGFQRGGLRVLDVFVDGDKVRFGHARRRVLAMPQRDDVVGLAVDDDAVARPGQLGDDAQHDEDNEDDRHSISIAPAPAA